MLEPVVIQLSQEATVPFVSKVNGAQFPFKELWLEYLKRPPVWHPGNDMAVSVALAQNGMKLLRKGHVGNTRWK